MSVRRSVALLAVALLAGLLAGCGSDSGAGPASKDRLEAVTISGAVGQAPQVDWKAQMTATGIESHTVVKGDGPVIDDKTNVLSQIWIGDGFTKAQAFSTYDKPPAQIITTGQQLAPFLASVKGATIGSRIAVTSSAEAAFGATGNVSIGIANKDTVLVIVDLVSAVPDSPSGQSVDAPTWMPPISMDKGKPSGFDFTKAPDPTKNLRKAVLVKGDGPVVKTGQTIVVQYLGEVFGGKKSFDENYSTGQPTTFVIGKGAVIKAWDQAIVGATVGTRMVIEVPPDLGYGSSGNSQAGIKGTDTLVFVIDVLAAA